MRARTLFSILSSLALLALLTARADAAQVRYLGPHPIAAKHGGGYCYIEAPHLHLYGPDHPNLYQQVDGEYVFAGDPTPFGYDGEKHPYYGHHPILVEGASAPVYCLIEGPHFHPYAAPEAPEYKMKNGVAFYVAPIPDVYVKPHRVKLVNAEYRPFVSFRPTVEVAPPPEWHGEVYVAGPSVEVRAPGVFVPPPPGVSVEVHGPGVFVPPPPHVAVEVRAPGVFVPGPPGVVVGAPGPVFVGGGRGHWENHERMREVRHEEHFHREVRHEEHHDEGKHRGLAQMRRMLLALTLLSLSACHKDKTEGGVQLQQVSDAFSSAGLKTEGFAPSDATAFHAQKCVAGKVEGIDAVVCEYASPDAVALGKKAGEAWAAGANTAAVLGNGRTVLAVADRARVDPNGKTIHKITHAFRQLK